MKGERSDSSPVLRDIRKEQRGGQWTVTEWAVDGRMVI